MAFMSHQSELGVISPLTAFASDFRSINTHSMSSGINTWPLLFSTLFAVALTFIDLLKTN